MQKLISLSIVLLCIGIFASCNAPDNSENGPVRIHDLSINNKLNSPNDTSIIHRVKTKGVGISLAKAFNDKNDIQLSVAQRIGINPIQSLHDAFYLKRPLKKITTCNDFFLDSLTHSMPYLVPEADKLLHDIGKAFNDTILARTKGHTCQIIVTSVLRTDNTVKRLRKRNVNATEASCHMFGTTFDISWRRFYYSEPGYIMYTEDLKNILAEILYNLQKQGRCYVKFERKQSCFHITAR